MSDNVFKMKIFIKLQKVSFENHFYEKVVLGKKKDVANNVCYKKNTLIHLNLF
jgi:hypothetical protein